jgi:hypothetical protein
MGLNEIKRQAEYKAWKLGQVMYNITWVSDHFWITCFTNNSGKLYSKWSTQHFSNLFLATLHISLEMTSIHCRYKTTVAKLLLILHSQILLFLLYCYYSPHKHFKNSIYLNEIYILYPVKSAPFHFFRKPINLNLSSMWRHICLVTLCMGPQIKSIH